MEDLSQLILENKGKGNRREGRNGGGKQTSGNSGVLWSDTLTIFFCCSIEQWTSKEIMSGRSVVTKAYLAIAMQTILKVIGSTTVNLRLISLAHIFQSQTLAAQQNAYASQV